MAQSSAMRAGVFLTAEWRYLAMLSFEVDPVLLRSRVPAGTELDAWRGMHLVTLVGFWFQNTKLYGWAVPFHADFEEVNLRFYVRRKGPEGWRRGVVFIKEIVPRRAVAAVARAFYNEQYVALPMRHRIEYPRENPMFEPTVVYAWRIEGRWNELAAQAEGYPQEIGEGSEEEFVAEHYWGYSAQRNGGCLEYEVEHPRWSVWPVQEYRLDCDAGRLYGDGLGQALTAPARSAFLAYGSPVTVRHGRRLES